jgi:predicted MFS family arabinose efflux permease
MATTTNLNVFIAVQFLTGVATVTPQIMLPLVGDLAPPQRRASAMSIVVSGLTMGILVARVLSGIMTEYLNWRSIFWLSVALQYTVWFLLYLFMPDYPSSNPSGLNYFKMLWSMLIMLTKHAILVQACFITFFTAATFTNFWTTLTFLLSNDPYNYSTLVIGLFALIGIVSMCIGPFHARIIIDRFVPIFSVLLGMMYCLIGITLGTYTGTFTVAGPVIQAFLNDFGMQTCQIANRTALFAVEPKGRSRVNTVFMVATFCGQLVGTSVGSNLYDRGGWIASGSYSMGSIGAALIVCSLRGPWEKRWFGWRGGWSIRKKTVSGATEERNHLRRLDTKEKLEDQEKRDNTQRDLERGEKQREEDLVHERGRCDQDAVNAMGVEQALEGLAAEDKTDAVYGEDKKPLSPESGSVKSVPVQEHRE